MQQQLADFLRTRFPDADDITIEHFDAIPGGFSRETFRFDAHVRRGRDVDIMPMILRKDPPAASALLITSRQVEHDLIEAVRAHTEVPVSRSYGYVLDPAVFGEAAMVIERMHGSGQTSALFNDGEDAHQTDDVIRHLCEVMAALHMAPVDDLNVGGSLTDPRGVGIRTSSWHEYMDTTFQYYLDSYFKVAFDPSMAVYADAVLYLRRAKPRPLRLSVVHGDFNPANFLYQDGKVTALIDWENSRVGDPREDLGWMVTMDLLSNTSVMAHPRDEGGFLAYYNKLTGFDVTQAELDYFSLFGTMNIAVPVSSAVKRRVDREHHQFLTLYLLQPSIANLVNFAQMLGYPLGAA
jgi:aminoglycoside phosphotransferase (APT) family kinase protein